MCTRRLRIVDAQQGAQPQASFDGRLLVSFNGEIYNHAELRQELEQLGIRLPHAKTTPKSSPMPCRSGARRPSSA